MANDINSVTLCGRLTRDIEVKYSSSGVAIGRFSVANSQSRKQGDQWAEESHFFDCTLLGRRADALQQYLNKGQQVVVLGVLQQNRWQDKTTGANRSKVEILVNDIQLVGGRNSASSADSSAAQNDASQSPPYASDEDEDDQIPF